MIRELKYRSLSLSDESYSNSRLTVKKRKFAEELYKGLSAKDAVKKAYNVRTERSIKQMAYVLAKDPAVKTYIDQKFKDDYPDMETDIISKVKAALKSALKMDGGITVGELVQLLNALAKIRGWVAPSKHQTLSADLTNAVSKMMILPEEDEENVVEVKDESKGNIPAEDI